MAPLLLGCIADDLTGATDLANTLARRGMSVVQTIGVPSPGDPVPDAEAIVVALKSRTIAARDAVALSLQACRWLKAAGARQFYFKYCSTFDSTDQGNIGPVGDALVEELDAGLTTVCPAFPETGRTIYLGHLFVGRDLLSDSPMRNHPLTPMRDANLVRVLSRQTRARVDLVPITTVRQGASSMSASFGYLTRKLVRYAVIDAIEDEDLLTLGAACAEMKLMTGGSGAAIGLPENFRQAGLIPKRDAVTPLDSVGGLGAVVAGSSSQATMGQIAAMRAQHPALALEPLKLAEDFEPSVAAVLDWARPKLSSGPVLIHAGGTPKEVAAVQEKLGRERAGELVEQALAKIAQGLVAAGVRRLVVAGGETSGAVVQGLGVKALQIGPQIDPGVPACLAIGTPRLALALKSGNFGAEDFFMKALDVLK
ncbi:3-oxo-tetronate kinase [Dongia sedimenti]|uniref:3-oxo-tetronate kinase n=1 Tax=Dongia sedimenti TaxID=3064282 RepID=A0ABU0YLK6_9PROT|nr:four-carbon acid sugar kinase family protein [Rhodospirillaceae bacterium R-7]